MCKGDELDMKMKLILSLLVAMLLLCGCEKNIPIETTVDKLETESLEMESLELKSESEETQIETVTADSNKEVAEQPDKELSAYENWQTIRFSESKRSMYESIYQGQQEMEHEMSCGWFDDSTIALLELITGKDMSLMTYDERIDIFREVYKEIGDSGYNVWDFFTVDEYGNSTSDGIYNFLDTAHVVLGDEVVWYDENGGYHFDTDSIGGDEILAKELGISVELVHILLYAAIDAGFDVNID